MFHDNNMLNKNKICKQATINPNFRQFLYTLLLILFQIHDTSKKYKTTY